MNEREKEWMNEQWDWWMVWNPAAVRGTRRDGACLIFKRLQFWLQMNSDICSGPYWLYNLGEVTCPLWASVSPSVNCLIESSGELDEFTWSSVKVNYNWNTWRYALERRDLLAGFGRKGWHSGNWLVGVYPELDMNTTYNPFIILLALL